MYGLDPELSPTELERLGRAPAAAVAVLEADVHCARCGYNLRGISIRSVCPECGAAVRATILAVVDPHASELQPIRHPWPVAAGLVLWAASALVLASIDRARRPGNDGQVGPPVDTASERGALA